MEYLLCATKEALYNKLLYYLVTLTLYDEQQHYLVAGTLYLVLRDHTVTVALCNK